MPQERLKLTVATRNMGKLHELNRWVEAEGSPVTLLCQPDAPDVEETGRTFLENARLKASQTLPAEDSQLILAEDSGLVVEALDGQFGLRPFPGIYSNRWLEMAADGETLEDRCVKPVLQGLPSDSTVEVSRSARLNEALLSLMQGRENRAAAYHCGMVLWHAQQGLLFEVETTTLLRIVFDMPRGEGGFGYDPVTIPLETKNGFAETRTMAQLSPHEKNQISHRGKAFQAVLWFLRTRD